MTISRFERYRREKLSKSLTTLGYSWRYNHRSYRVFYKGEWIFGAGIAKDAPSPRGRAATAQREENHYHAMLSARDHMLRMHGNEEVQL